MFSGLIRNIGYSIHIGTVRYLMYDCVTVSVIHYCTESVRLHVLIAHVSLGFSMLSIHSNVYWLNVPDMALMQLGNMQPYVRYDGVINN